MGTSAGAAEAAAAGAGAAAAVVARLLAQPHVRGQADRARHLRARLPADQRVQSLRELALGGIARPVQPFGDDEAEHAIAQEFQPLVIARGVHAAVSQRLAPQRGVGRGRPGQVSEERVCFRRKRDAGQNRPPMRFQRAALNQVQGLIQLAEPSVDATSPWVGFDHSHFSCH